MIHEDPLFSLIHSLTQHEKRYFKRHNAHNNKDNDSQVFRLFQLLEGKEVYDEAELKEKLGGDMLGKQLPVYKNLLFHAILRSQQSYRYERSPGMKVRSGIDKVEILVEKGAYPSALKMLQRTAKIAEEYAQAGYLREILAWERRLLRHLHPMDFMEEVRRIEAKEEKMLATQRQEMEAVAIYDNVFALVQMERRMEKDSLAQHLEQLRARLDALDAVLEPSFLTRSATLNSKAIFNQLKGDYQAMMHHYRLLIDLWDSNPKIKAAEPQRYSRLQIAWLNSTLAAGKIAQHLALIRSFRKIPIQGIPERARSAFQSYNLELLYLIDQKDLPSAVRFLHGFEGKLPEMQPYLDELRLNSFFLNAAIIYFRGFEYAKALAWANRSAIHGAAAPKHQPLQERHAHRRGMQLRNGQFPGGGITTRVHWQENRCQGCRLGIWQDGFERDHKTASQMGTGGLQGHEGQIPQGIAQV
jgi:hypothetical protein